MSLLERIEKDFIAAYKAKDDLRVSVLRMVKTAAKNKQVELMRPLDDGEVLDVLARQVKQRRESIEQFTQGGRPDLAAKEEGELAILTAYMPSRLSGAELAAGIEQALAECAAKGPGDMGKVMKIVLERFKGRVDGKTASDMVKARLAALAAPPC